MNIPAKRKLGEHGIEQEEASEVVFIMKHEPEELQRSHLVRLLVGDNVQLATRKAIQDLLSDPAYFQCAPNPKGHEYRIIIPHDVDPWATHLVLLAALNEGMPLDCKSSAKGLTLQKLHRAAEFLKVNTDEIGLIPLTFNEGAATVQASDEVQTSNSESEESWNNNTGDLPDSGTIYLFTGDQNQVHFRRYDCCSENHYNIKLSANTANWSVYKEMGPVFDSGLLFRIGDGQQVETYSYSFKKERLNFLFEEKIDSGENYPLTVISGSVYRWDFKSRGAKSNKSFRYDTNGKKTEGALKLPKKFRKEAAFASWKEKLYYCGGFLTKDPARTALTTVEIYDAEGNKWSNLPRMNQPRRYFAAQVCSGYLYVTGGAYDQDSGIHNSCERLKLDGDKAKWETIGSLRVPRYRHCMFVLGGKMYVCGGQTSRGQPVYEVESYDDSCGSWREVDMKLGWPITSCQAVE